MDRLARGDLTERKHGGVPRKWDEALLSEAETVAHSPQVTGAFAPLRQPLFRALWIATIASNVGTWMQEVGAAWLMTSLAASPVMVALVRAATSLPMFMLALPAGALADIVDRRRLLLFSQAWMLLAAASLAVLTLAGMTTPTLLLTLTLALGIGTALNAPAWQAIVPEIVPRAQLPQAVSLNSMSINLARSVGPALAGLLLAGAGPGATFLLNAVSFSGVMLVLYRWRRETAPSVLPAERMAGAMRAGLRYVRHAPAVISVLVRSGVFVLFGSAIWALLPSLARFEFGQGPTGFGLLLALFGVGAVTAALVLPRVRAALNVNRLVNLATLVFAAMMLILAWIHSFPLALLLMFVAGGAWLTLLSTFNASIQHAVPQWVRGRALAVSILVFFGGMTVGSVLWGWAASALDLRLALTLAALGAAASLLFTRRFRIGPVEELDLTPSVHWPAPVVLRDVEPEQGPVVVTVEYEIDPARRREFMRAMQRVRRIRKRDGAMTWALLGNIEKPGHYTETFIVESWLEHLRQHERVTVADRAVLDKARAFHEGTAPPRVTHYIAERLPATPPRSRRRH